MTAAEDSGLKILITSLVGWVHLVGGPADLQGGQHIFFKCGKAGEQKRAGASTLAGGAPPPWAPPTLRGW